MLQEQVMSIRKIDLFLLLILFIPLQGKSQKLDSAYTSETLKIIPISETSFVHVTYLNTNDFGKVACNGLVYINNTEAAIFDTPSDKTATEELIRWVTQSKQAKIIAVVVNHFHIDALGGLKTFHDMNIPSYANDKTIELAKNDGVVAPQIGFADENELRVGNGKVFNGHFGEAHTTDNIISYIPDEELLYGGCMIKSLNASKGNLEDANTDTWSETVSQIKVAHPHLKTVVPGHGKHGTTELLDYTIQLFKTD